MRHPEPLPDAAAVDVDDGFGLHQRGPGERPQRPGPARLAGAAGGAPGGGPGAGLGTKNATRWGNARGSLDMDMSVNGSPHELHVWLRRLCFDVKLGKGWPGFCWHSEGSALPTKTL